MKNELLEEVWRVRDEIAAEHNYNISKLASTLRAQEAEYGERLVRLPVKRKAKAIRK